MKLKCVYKACGARQWDVISTEQYQIAKRILDLSDNKPAAPRWYRFKGAADLLKRWTGRIFSTPHSDQASITSFRTAPEYRSNNGIATPQPAKDAPERTGGSTSMGRAGSEDPEDPSKDPEDPPEKHQTGWILVGVRRARWIVALDEIHVHESSTDDQIFKNLRNCYTSQRGRLRLWFSIWRLGWFDAVKVLPSLIHAVFRC